MSETNLGKPDLKSFLNSQKGKRSVLWLTFFLFWGGSAAVLPYISIYFENVGLSGRQIGQLSSIPFFVTLVSSVVFGFITDVSKQTRLLLRIVAVGLIIVLFLYPSGKTYWTIFPMMLVYSIFHAPVNPILDETTLNGLDDPEIYGKIRSGGSIGWGLVVLATGFLIDNLGLGVPVIFTINMVFMMAFFLIVGILPVKDKQQKETNKQISLKALGKMLKKPGVFLLFVVIIIWGMGEAAIGSFLFLHIKHLGGSSTLMGTALSISLIGEIVTFTFANRIQARIGEFRMILLAFVVLILWLTGLSLIKDPNIIPAFQVFGGAGFALMHSGSVAYINRKAPKELGTTAQALRGGLYAGFGSGIGALISGVLYETYQSATLFRIMAIVEVCGLIFGIFVYLRDHRKRRMTQIK